MADYRDANVVMEGVRLVFRNFSGKEGMYNREGDRNFSVILESDVAEAMANDGWNIKYLKPRDDDEDPHPTPYLAVTVGYKGRPPQVVMITSKGRANLGEDEVELLDWVDIKNVDLIVRPYDWNVSGKTGRKAYLQSIFMTIEENPLELKYASVPQIGSSRRLAIEAPEDDDIIDGEVLE